MSTSDFEEEVKRKRIAFGSLFSGIGGIDLGLERAGMHCLWQVEKDAFCTKVLQKHWPNTPRYGDIRDLVPSTLASVDLIAGGPPCQPHSLAGKRQASADERNLWPEFARIIRSMRPRWVLVENVLGLLSSEDGDFFGKVLWDLATCGYDAQWFVLSAAQFGAPHRRCRVFIVAHATGCGFQECQGTEWVHTESHAPDPCHVADSQCLFSLQYDSSSIKRRWEDATQQTGMGSGDVADANHLQQWIQQEQEPGSTDSPIVGNDGTQWNIVSPTGRAGQIGGSQSGMGRDASRFPGGLDRYRWPAGPGSAQYPWEPPRVVQEKVPHRSERLKALGNSVVPQIAEYIGQWIMECDHERV